MRVVHQGVVEIGGGTLPGQYHFIGIAGIAVDYGIVGIDGGGIGDPQGAVRWPD